MERSAATGLPRWARLIVYALAIAAFFWLVPSIRTPERLKIFVPVAMLLFLLEGLRENLAWRSIRSRAPSWLRVPLYYGLVAVYIYALPWLRTQPKPAMYAAILALLWAVHTMSRETYGVQRVLMIAPLTVSFFFTMGWQNALTHSRFEFGIVAAWLAFAGTAWLIFHLQHQPTSLSRGALLLHMPVMIVLAGVTVYLVRMNLAPHDPWVPWLTWPLIAAIVVTLLISFVLPLWLFVFSRMHRALDRLEYAVANENWTRALELLPKTRAIVGENPLFKSTVYQYEGQVHMALGQRSAAIQAWEKGVELSAGNRDNRTDFRVIGGLLAAAYEQAGEQEKLRPLIHRLITSWSESGRKATGEIRKLTETHVRVFGRDFQGDLDEDDAQLTLSS